MSTNAPANARPVTEFDLEQDVKARYAAGAEEAEAALCCPTSYELVEYLKELPAEIIERDYGCGDPTPYVNEGETVLDLGSGGGKVCYILQQLVGEHGRVIGVDFNDAMLDLAGRHKAELAAKFGYDNVSFRKGKIQDLKLDFHQAEAWLKANPIDGIEGVQAFEAECDRLRRTSPMIPDNSVDVVVSNCVLNLVRPEEKAKLFAEIFRVLKVGGRAVISDVVCDEPVPEAMVNDSRLWSGCISGAFEEHDFLQRFADVGFYGMEVLKRPAEPWQTVGGIEFRGVTVRAFKGKQGACMEHRQAVIYRGPFSQTKDDDGHTFYRGRRMAVCDKTFRLLTNPAGPYAGQFDAVEPREPVTDPKPFDCRVNAVRDPRETKGQDYDATTEAADCCGDAGGCC